MEEFASAAQSTLNVDSAIAVDSDTSFESISSEDTTIVEPDTAANMSEMKTYHIHRFNGLNYQLWRRQMEIYMAENKLKNYILGTEARTASKAAVWDEKDAEAQAFLMRGLELDQLKYLTDCSTSAQRTPHTMYGKTGSGGFG